MPHKNIATLPLPGKDLNNEVILFDRSKNRWLYFQNPVEVVSAHTLLEVDDKLKLIENLTQSEGYHAAGFISYEAAPAFDEALQVKQVEVDNFPLLWFGIYEEVLPISFPATENPGDDGDDEWTSILNENDYRCAIDHIKQRIAAGDTYQVNYTTRLRKLMDGNGWQLFGELVRKQQNGYPAYVNTGDYVICSASPELFFRLQGNLVTTKPMKGTASRGRFHSEDQERSSWLKRSKKNRAENLMIVDMIRNDLGRIARTGSVKVKSLFEVEKYPTVWQMTSTVTARSNALISDIIAALFPCASVTGAPKASTMEIISQLEYTPRKIYTGTIGYIGPNRNAQFNVAIRTVLIDREKKVAEYGVGGGIIWDSDVSDEYEECKIKTRVLSEKRPSFALLETLLWTPNEGYILLDEHLRRLTLSASYFDYTLDIDQVADRLNEIVTGLIKSSYKVRLLLDQKGEVSVQKESLAQRSSSKTIRIALAAEPINSDNVFLYHKTTNRSVYENAISFFRNECDDVLLWNERGEITESTISNIVVEMNGRLVTPPVRCGLLAGTFRNSLIKQKLISEKIITLNMLENCKKIYLINSVRLWREAELLRSFKTTLVHNHMGLSRKS